MIHHRLSTIAAALLLVASAAPPASAAFITYDLTGTWAGSIKCSDDVAGAKQKTVATPVMRISQLGVNFGVQLDFGTTIEFYGGLTNPDVKKPEQKGEAILIRCGTDNALGTGITDEMARMSASTKPGKVKASFKGFSLFSSAADSPHHGTCKWKFTRTDTVDPNFATSCTLNGLQARGAR